MQERNPAFKLREKSKEIEELLDPWAREQELLQPGEKVVVSITIVRTTTAEENMQEILMKRPVEFFTRERLIRVAGATDHAATRIKHFFLTYDAKWARENNYREKDIDIPTVKALLTLGRWRLEHMRGAGKVLITAIEAVLKEQQLFLSE
jgi:hypothetical protein